jgi:GntR family transcriptional regulator
VTNSALKVEEDFSRSLDVSSGDAGLRLKVSPIPFYVQVRDALRTQIMDGALGSHEKMPSEQQMTVMFGVSRITIRQALKELENEGLIFRVHGKGTFVSKPKAFQDLTTLQSFGEAMHPQGYETYSKLIAIKEIEADPQVTLRLKLSSNETIVEIKRIRYLNREPMSYETSYFPIAIGRKLSREDLSTQDILVILENTYRIDVGHADLVLGAHLADENQARLLNVECGSPMLHIERLTTAADGSPLMYEHLFHRGDAYRYTVRVNRG